jgi:hypothetical protein
MLRERNANQIVGRAFRFTQVLAQEVVGDRFGDSLLELFLRFVAINRPKWTTWPYPIVVLPAPSLSYICSFSFSACLI